MVDLSESRPSIGERRTIGAATLEPVDLGPLTMICPFAGAEASVSKVLDASSGLRWPGPGRSEAEGNARFIWFGRMQALLTGAAVSDELSRFAGITDQSDAWATVLLSGDAAEDVLARLVPVDLRLQQFPPNQTARTMVQHMNASVTRVADHAFLIMVFRSMAQTLAHELETAMESVAARG